MRPNRAAQTTRRSFLSGAAAGVAAPVLIGSISRTNGIAAGSMLQDEIPSVGEAGSPAWTIRVLTFTDPYEGAILFPAEPAEGTRYAGAEVEIVNDSDSALAVSAGQIRLRASDKQEYTANAVGSEPRVFDVNMLPGERTRGWVWFTLPQAAESSELLYSPPAPLLRVRLIPDE